MQLWSAHPGSTILQDQSSPPVHSTPFHKRYQRVWKPEYTPTSRNHYRTFHTRGATSLAVDRIGFGGQAVESARVSRPEERIWDRHVVGSPMNTNSTQ